VNFSGPEGATPLGNGALAAEPGLAEASRRVLAGFAQAVDSINCMSLSEYVYIYHHHHYHHHHQHHRHRHHHHHHHLFIITIIIITITSLRSHWNLSNILHINMYTKQNYI
jgi:hypothetical protein